MSLQGFKAFDAACCLAANFTARKAAVASRLPRQDPFSQTQDGLSPSSQGHSASVAVRSANGALPDSTMAMGAVAETEVEESSYESSETQLAPTSISQNSSIVQCAATPKTPRKTSWILRCFHPSG